MHTICFNPDLSLRSRPSLSLPFNHASYLLDEMFERNPVVISSPKCCCSCCCCYSAANNSMYNRLSAMNPSLSCKGLRQSTFIQCSLSKRITFHSSVTRIYGNTFGVSSLTDLDRNYSYENLCSFKEKRNQKHKGFGHKRKKQILSNVSNDHVSEVEVMLSLLTNEVGLECISVTDRKKIDKKHIICENKEKKNIGCAVAKKDLECGMAETSLLSETRMNNFEENSTEVGDNVKDIKEKKHQETDSLTNITTVCSEKTQQILHISNTHFTNSENSSVSHRKSDKHKLYPETSSLELKMVERTTNGCLRNSSHESEQKGPSDEMWHVIDASDKISSSSENGNTVKNNGKSLWTFIGNVFRLRSCSESHFPKCSTCLSLSSKSWFSSHEPDDSDNEEPSGTTESSIPLPSIKKSSHVYGELKGRDIKDNFDEWEDACNFESKQRKEDEMFMREAILESKKAADVCEVPVGAVLVKDGKIIARGYNLVEELRDSTAHAEMICIRQASKNLESWRLLDTTLYVTLEPCPMCAGAILQARIDTLVWGAPNKLLGADGSWISLFSDGNEEKDSMPTDKPPGPVHPFHRNMAVRRGVQAAECAEIMQHFFRMRRNKKTEPESPIPSEPESVIPPDLESRIPPSSTTVSQHHSNFFSKMQHAFKIIFCL